jgi:hypothetical protein
MICFENAKPTEIRQWEQEYIYIYQLYRTLKRSWKKIDEKIGFMTSLYTSSKNERYLKRSYIKEGKKEKYNMINTVVRYFNELAYLTV